MTTLEHVPVRLIHTPQYTLGALPPPTELGFTRVRHLSSGRSRIYPTSAWGRVGEGGRAIARRWCHIAPPPPLTPPHKSLRPGARKRGPGGEGNRARRVMRI